MNKLLTVVITTYNRNQLLLETLKSFESQGLYDQYKILLSNNCSDYNVDEWLDKNLSKEFLDIITIFNRPYNVGGDINISFTFQLCDTKWMWLMSDDDKAMPDSIAVVLNDIIQMPDVAHIKYSIDGYARLPDKLCYRFGDVLDVFISPDTKYGYGQFIGLAPYYANTCMTQLIPSIFAICKEHLQWKISSNYISNFEPYNASYEPIYAILNFVNIQLINADLNNQDIKKLRKLFFHRGIRQISKDLIGIRPSIKSHLLFYRLWSGNYPFLSIRGILFYLYFHYRLLFNFLKND